MYEMSTKGLVQRHWNKKPSCKRLHEETWAAPWFPIRYYTCQDVCCQASKGIVGVIYFVQYMFVCIFSLHAED
jgi:hypothetical protein